MTFKTGETSKSFTVVAVDDAVEDDDEMVALGFGTLPGGLVEAPPATATLTIMNQENGQPSEDKCDSAIWCATVTFGNLNGSSHAFSYHPRNTDSSMSKRPLHLQGHEVFFHGCSPRSISRRTTTRKTSRDRLSMCRVFPT